MTTVTQDEVAVVRAHAIRALLASPLLDRDAGDDFVAVARERDWLARWFDHKCGWPLMVDARHGFARLRKIPATVGGTYDDTRPAVTRRSTPRPFTRRAYTLLCLAAAALSDTPRPQVSLQDLAAHVTRLATSTESVAPYDPTHRPDRMALVDALGALTGLGILGVVEVRGDYSAQADGNALYDLDDRRLAHLIAAPRPPSLSSSLQHLMHEDRYGPWHDAAERHEGADADDTDTVDAADLTAPTPRRPSPALVRSRELSAVGLSSGSDEQNRRQIRHRLMRILLDSPVLYADELTDQERTYLSVTIGPFQTWAREAGMILERRTEGWALIDPDDAATDIVFPEGNDLIKHAALMLLDELRPDDAPSTPVRHPRPVAEHLLDARLRANPTWARRYQNKGSAAMAGDALELLRALRLVTVDETSIQLLPAAGRYRPQQVADSTDAADAEASDDTAELPFDGAERAADNPRPGTGTPPASHSDVPALPDQPEDSP